MRQLKMDSENVQQCIKLDEIVFEKLKTRGVKTIYEAVHSGAYVNAATGLFNDFEEHLAYWRLRRRVTFLLAKCFECLANYHIGMYLRFKEKLMTDWPEMLDISPTDQMALKTAERMQIYYKILCANEFWVRS
jgi:hypothetical protein